MYRRIRALLARSQGTFRALHGTYCLLSWLKTRVVLLLVIRVLRDIIGGAVQELATSLIEDTASVSVAILHSFRCLPRLCILELFEIFLGIPRSLDDLLIEVIVFGIVVRILGLAILHGAFHVLLIFLIVISLFHDRRLLLLFPQVLFRRSRQLRGARSQAHNLPGLGII